jgi:hypothetical protein
MIAGVGFTGESELTEVKLFSVTALAPPTVGTKASNMDL